MEKHSRGYRGAGGKLLKGTEKYQPIFLFNMKSPKTFNWFRKTAFTEGVSFIVLLFIAMPLKYWGGIPMAVTIVGGLHGLLFLAFIVLAWEVKREYKRSWGWLAKSFIASIIPFGTFWMDSRQWKKEEVAISTSS
jgi:integral membrane protein